MWGHGFPGGFFDMGGEGQSSDTDKEVDNKGLYEVLELPQTATTDEIKKSI